jgi:hypothetical protein
MDVRTLKIPEMGQEALYDDYDTKLKSQMSHCVMMFTACLPQHSQNPTRSNRSSGLTGNSYVLNKHMIIDNS